MPEARNTEVPSEAATLSLKSRLAPRYGAYFLILLCVVVLWWRYPGNENSFKDGPPLDFGVYLKAFDRVTQGKSPYVATEYSAFKYSPGVLGLMHFLPPTASASWVMFATLCLLAFGVVLGASALFETWAAVGWLGAGLALGWKGILETLDYGQLELLLFAIAVGAAALLRKAPFFAGLLVGALPWFKLPWGFLLFPFTLVMIMSRLALHQKRAKRARLLISGYFLSWFIWGAAVPSLIFGPDLARKLTREWFEVLSAQPQALFLSDINQSAWVSALRWLPGSPMLAGGLVATMAGILLGMLVARPSQSGSIPEQRIHHQEALVWVSPWLLFTQLLNPLSWRWGSVFVVGMPLAIAHMSETGNSWASPRVRRFIWGAVILFALLQINPIVHALGFKHWTELHGSGVVTAFWFSLLLLAI